MCYRKAGVLENLELVTQFQKRLRTKLVYVISVTNTICSQCKIVFVLVLFIAHISILHMAFHLIRLINLMVLRPPDFWIETYYNICIFVN